MSIHTRVLAGVTAVLTAAAFAGDLTPPTGAPAPTMRTLHEIEPRTPIGAATTPGDADSVFRIHAPGSYYLTADVVGMAGKVGIEIAAQDVTVDMGGFRVRGVAGSLDGMRVTAASPRGVAVRNGTLQGWGGHGLNLAQSSVNRVENVVCEGNGGSGIAGGQKTILLRCQTDSNAQSGVSGGYYFTIEGCSATDNGQSGVAIAGIGTIRDCVSTNNGATGFSLGRTSAAINLIAINNTGAGIEATAGSTIDRCASNLNGFGLRVTEGSSTIRGCAADANTVGISVGAGSIVSECTVSNSDTDGIVGASACVIQNNQAQGNSAFGVGAGIRATGSSNRIDSNNVTANDFGVRCEVADNVVVRNTARGNQSNYSFPSGAEYGQIVTDPGVNFSNSNPWSNFAY